MLRARGNHNLQILLAACAVGCLFFVRHAVYADAQVAIEESQSRLTHVRTTITLAVPSEVFRQHPSLLIVPITHITNESLTPVSVYAYLTWNETQSGDRPRRLLLGQVTIFPADRPGTFTIRLSRKFQDLLSRPTISIGSLPR